MNDKPVNWRTGWQLWFGIFVAILLVVINFWGGIHELMRRWQEQEEYSHGFLIPFVTLYFIWQKRHSIQQSQFFPSWLGFLVVAIGLLVFFIGEISALFILIQYALIVVLIGLALAMMGGTAVKPVLAPLFILIFAIPLPYFIEAGLSAQLQLLSSKLGVVFIRWCQIPVYLEGNLIDLGVYKLQVVEACSGLRYLFPLMGFGFICAYLFNTVFWKRAVLFLTTIPITIIMNSFRIGMTGVLVNSLGISVAEGFLHDFEGWIVFIACLGILVLEMMLLTKIGQDKRPLAEVFGLSDELVSLSENSLSENSSSENVQNRELSYPLIASIGLLIAVTVLTFSIDKREELIPVHKNYAEFPMDLAGWQGSKTTIEDNVTAYLGLSDYVMANYHQDNTPPVNLYIAYYENQRKGVSPHSPSVCIPGGGWQIAGISTIQVENFPVNRVVIDKDGEKQLVYYWFQERGRKIANEYVMKWYLLEDAVFLNRTDGALVRLTTPVASKETLVEADKRLQLFTKNLLPILSLYVPD